jgi:hypothetical protein
MNGRIMLLSLISAFLLFALVVGASAQTRTVGVSVGNKFRYSPTVNWSSTDPNATLPSFLVDANNSQWAEFTITAVSGTNITIQGTTHYKNGTEVTMGGWVDVDTGIGDNITTLLISANLAKGDSIYNSSQYTTTTINETSSRTYTSGPRDTNHLSLTASGQGQTANTNYYWDKSTGVFVEVLRDYTNQTGGYTTFWSEDIQIVSSDLWIVPEFPTWTSTLLIFIALTSATMVIARQKQPKRPFR